jgi:2-keto-4-pentenoate hydratase/2-oxohepta-3-ene-1,7-dioic acid hydratase in catechol pathway
MRIASNDGRAAILRGDGLADLEEASGGRFGPDPQDLFESWDELRSWEADWDGPVQPIDPSRLRLPVPRPRQVFGIGLNYAAHAAEGGQPNPTFPPTFTKFPTCLTGPDATVELPTDGVDWEVELVVVIGRRAHHVPETEAWAHVAGLTIGQDLSEREVQRRPPVPQFSLGKSFPGFGPTGPWIVTPDELSDPDDLRISCELNGEVVQDSRTSDLIFSVPALVDRLSSICPLLPGDLIFTGTPSGVGVARTPPRFLSDGDQLVSRIEGIGELRTRLAKPDGRDEHTVRARN